MQSIIKLWLYNQVYLLSKPQALINSYVHVETTVLPMQNLCKQL